MRPVPPQSRLDPLIDQPGKPYTQKQAAMLADPVGFAKGVCGHSLWRMQAEILRAVWSNRRTAVKSCHASGKTFLSADAALAWITLFPDGIVVTTAPTWTHVKTILWGEIRKAANGARIKYPRMNLMELKIAEGNYAIGISSNDANRLSGFHSGNVLIIMDEAPGVKQVIWDAIAGLRSGGRVSVLAIGNPIILGGQFHDAFTVNRGAWKTFTISAFDTPNLLNASLEYVDEFGVSVRHGKGKSLLEMDEQELDWGIRPTLCSRRWVYEIFNEWGPQHPYFQSRVLGEFATQSDATLLPLSWLEKAKLRGASDDFVLPRGNRPRAGLDVAGPGEDRTVLVVRIGPHVVFRKAWPQADPRGEVIAALAPWAEDLEAFNIDSIGVGWGIYLHMKDIFQKADRKCKVNPINVGSEPRDKEKFFNAKAEFYWGLRQRAQAGDLSFAPELAGPDLERMIGQLTCLQYRHNARGQICIESKDELRRRGVKSPDEAEGAMLAFAEPKAKMTGGLFELVSVGMDGNAQPTPESVNLEVPSGWRMGGR